MGNLLSCAGSGPALQVAVASDDAQAVQQVSNLRRSAQTSTFWLMAPGSGLGGLGWTAASCDG